MNTLDETDMLQIEGGNPFLVPIIVGISIGVGNAIASTVINNWDSFKAGVLGDPNPALKNTNK